MGSKKDKVALKFCFIYGKQHGSAILTQSQFEQVKSILYGSEETQAHKG